MVTRTISVCLRAADFQTVVTWTNERVCAIHGEYLLRAWTDAGLVVDIAVRCADTGTRQRLQGYLEGVRCELDAEPMIVLEAA